MPDGLAFLSITLFAIAGGVLLQGTLADMFFTTAAREARLTHGNIGDLLPYLAIVPAVTAWRRVNPQVQKRIPAMPSFVSLTNKAGKRFIKTGKTYPMRACMSGSCSKVPA